MKPEQKVAELKKRNQLAEDGGGAKRRERQHKEGKMSARERIEFLSFMTPDLLGKLQYGSPLVTIVADATVPGALGTFGWDDEGVPAQRTRLVDAGRFTGY